MATTPRLVRVCVFRFVGGYVEVMEAAVYVYTLLLLLTRVVFKLSYSYKFLVLLFVCSVRITH